MNMNTANRIAEQANREVKELDIEDLNGHLLGLIGAVDHLVAVRDRLFVRAEAWKRLTDLVADAKKELYGEADSIRQKESI